MQRGGKRGEGDAAIGGPLYCTVNIDLVIGIPSQPQHHHVDETAYRESQSSTQNLRLQNKVVWKANPAVSPSGVSRSMECWFLLLLSSHGKLPSEKNCENHITTYCTVISNAADGSCTSHLYPGDRVQNAEVGPQ